MADASPSLAAARDDFNELVRDIRPKLHRYCARMTGSVVDAEDVVQEALAKAYYALPTTDVSNLEGWLLRIAHNKAIDHLRKSKREPLDTLDEVPPRAELAPPLEARELATFAMSVYLQLTPMQRSCVILKDVIGYSLAEISETLDVSVGAIKAALHRGRENLRLLANSLEPDVPLRLVEPEASLLARYVDRFNARDFDAVRAMLADDVRLDLVQRIQARGAAVGKYFTNYDKVDDWHLAVGFVDGTPAVVVSDPAHLSAPGYFVLLRWQDGKLAAIRDFRYARYVMADAAVVPARP